MGIIKYIKCYKHKIYFRQPYKTPSHLQNLFDIDLNDVSLNL